MPLPQWETHLTCPSNSQKLHPAKLSPTGLLEFCAFRAQSHRAIGELGPSENISLRGSCLGLKWALGCAAMAKGEPFLLPVSSDCSTHPIGESFDLFL